MKRKRKNATAATKNGKTKPPAPTRSTATYGNPAAHEHCLVAAGFGRFGRVCGYREAGVAVMWAVTGRSPDGLTVMRLEFRTLSEAVLFQRQWRERGWRMGDPEPGTTDGSPALKTRKETA